MYGICAAHHMYARLSVLYTTAPYALQVRLADEMRATVSSSSGTINDAFVYTTHAWLLSLFFDCPPGIGLECPDEAAVAELDAAIRRGDVTWHAGPFNAQVTNFRESVRLKHNPPFTSFSHNVSLQTHFVCSSAWPLFVQQHPLCTQLLLAYSSPSCHTVSSLAHLYHSVCVITSVHTLLASEGQTLACLRPIKSL